MNLRDRLRIGTRPAHEALESAQHRFALPDPDALRRFLAAERDAVSTLVQAGLEDGRMALALLDTDLAALGHDALAEKRSAPLADDEFARGYVWHSGRLSLRMLARAMPDDLPARRYLDMPRDVPAWRALCEELEMAPGYGTAAERSVVAANDWLALIETIRHDHARR